MTLRHLLLLAALAAQTGFSGDLAVSTYWKAGFTPAAIAADPEGNIYIAGSAVTDIASQATGVAVAKINPKATGYLYLSYVDSAANDVVSAMAVDRLGNAYIAGYTKNPNFPIVGGGALGTAPTGETDVRSFVMKLNSHGVVVLSVLIGGAAQSQARGIALTPEGHILVSGMATSSGFPSTPGAYSVANTNNQWFVMELDAGATKVAFSATGIGGSSIALDAAGNLYMAGSSIGTNYPTTPGAYQTQFSQGFYCFGFCRFGLPGNLQHVTKTDRAASKLIYSTGLNDPQGGAGSTTITALAVDSAGNAYVTGTLFQGKYPFTVEAPEGATGYLTKLDAAGANVLFSIPAGGGGLQLDAAGSVYVAGAVTSIISVGFPGLPGPAPTIGLPSAFSTLPQVCLPNFATSISGAYAVKVDAASGAVQDAQWIGGSATGATGIALAGGRVWITGPTPGPQLPSTPGVLTAQNLKPGFQAGAYLSAVDFRAAAPGPAIACVLDSGNLTHVGVVAPFQLISIFGSNLGPATPVQLSDSSAPAVGDLSVTFDGTPARLLYASASQINLAVPALPRQSGTGSLKTATVMTLTRNGVSVQRQFPMTSANLNLFADLSRDRRPCPEVPSIADGFQPVALNADGSANSCTSPAKAGSTVTLYAHGAGGFEVAPSELVGLHASFGSGCTALVQRASLTAASVYRLEVSLPASFEPCVERYSGFQRILMTVSYQDEPVGPFAIPADASGPTLNFTPPGAPMRMSVWVRD